MLPNIFIFKLIIKVNRDFEYKFYRNRFPNRNRKNNCGEKDQYLAEQLHPEIISKEIFDAVQSERQRRSNVVIDENGEKKRAGKRYCSKIMSETDIEPFDGTLDYSSYSE